MNKFEIAQSQARISGKPILLVFSGSDWCSWCMRLDREVFSQPEFQTWAENHVIKFVADYPQHLTQSDEEKQLNGELLEKYGVDGFPTVLLLDADGREIARTGYQPGGAANYAAMLEKLLSA